MNTIEFLKNLNVSLSKEQELLVQNFDNKTLERENIDIKESFNDGIEFQKSFEMIPVREIVKVMINQNPTYSNLIVHKTIMENENGDEQLVSAKVSTISMKGVYTFLKNEAIKEEIIFESSSGPQNPALFPRQWAINKGQEFIKTLQEEK